MITPCSTQKKNTLERTRVIAGGAWFSRGVPGVSTYTARSFQDPWEALSPMQPRVARFSRLYGQISGGQSWHPHESVMFPRSSCLTPRYAATREHIFTRLEIWASVLHLFAGDCCDLSILRWLFRKQIVIVKKEDGCDVEIIFF